MNARARFRALAFCLLVVPLNGSALAMPFVLSSSPEGLREWVGSALPDPLSEEPALHARTLETSLLIGQDPGLADLRLLPQSPAKVGWSLVRRNRGAVPAVQSLVSLRASLMNTAADPAFPQGPKSRLEPASPYILLLCGLLLLVGARFSRRPRLNLPRQVVAALRQRPAFPTLHFPTLRK